MPIDERMLIVEAIMSTVATKRRYDYNEIISFNPLIGITKREHKQWVGRHPAPGEKRSLIGGTDFKPLAWATKFIKFIKPKVRRGKRK